MGRHRQAEPTLGGVDRLPWSVPALVRHESPRAVGRDRLDQGRSLHYAGRGEGLLTEIRNIVDGGIALKGNGSWDVSAERSDPSEETVNLLVHQHFLDGPASVKLPLLSGEARVLARQVSAYRMDLIG